VHISANGQIVVNPGATQGRYRVTYHQGAASDSVAFTVTAGPPASRYSTVVLATPVVAGRPAVIRGVIRDANGNVVDGAHVVIHFDGQSVPAVTSAGGVFDVVVTPTVATDGQRVSVSLGSNSGPLLNAATLEPVHAALPASSRSTSSPVGTIVAGRPVTVVFTFRDAYGNPVANQPVAFTATGLASTRFGVVRGTQSSALVPLSQLGSVDTNAAGEVTLVIDDTAAGTGGRVTATVEGVAVSSGWDIVVPGPVSPALSTVTITASTIKAGQPVTVQGVLRDAYGNPIPDAGVVVTADGVSATAITNARGAFGAQLLPTQAVSAAPVQIRVGSGSAWEAPGLVLAVVGSAPSPVHSTVHLAQTTVVAGEPFVVTGTVADAYGNPLTGVPVTLTFDGQEATASTQNGSYTVSVTPTALTAGNPVSVSAGSGGGTLLAPGLVGRVQSGPISPLRSSLSMPSVTAAGAPIIVSGIVRNPYGVPLANVPVTATVDDVSADATTGPDGAFTLTVTPTVAGSALPFAVTAAGTALTPASSVLTVLPGTVSASQSKVKIPGSAVAGGPLTVTGVVRNTNGAPVANTLVAVTVEGNMADMMTSANGSFQLTDEVAAVSNSAAVVVTAGSGSTATVIGQSDIVVGLGPADPQNSSVKIQTVSENVVASSNEQQLEWSIEVSVSGTAYNSWDVPMSGATVVISCNGQSQSVSVTANGTFSTDWTFTVPTAGTYPLTVNVSSGGQNISIGSQSIQVGGGPGPSGGLF
jgi:protocatechuate 3,4-dioxygenase beta subunit